VLTVSPTNCDLTDRYEIEVAFWRDGRIAFG
jgi:hypothetical protein